MNQMYYLFSGSKLFRFLESNRRRIYFSLYGIIILLGLLSAVLLKGHLLLQTELFIFLGLLTIYLSNLFFKNQQSWLTFSVNSSLVINPFVNKRASYKSLLTNIFYPTHFSSLLFYLFVFYVSFYVIFRSKPTTSDFLNTVWVADVTIISITFVITSFIFELLREKGLLESKTSFLISRKTGHKIFTVINFLFVIVLGITCLNNAGLNQVKPVYLILAIDILTFAVFSILHLFLKLILLVEPSGLVRVTHEAIKKSIRNALFEEIFLRISRNQLYEIGKANNFDGSGYIFDRQLEPVTKKVKSLSIVTDINTGKLAEIASKLPKVKNGKIAIAKLIGSEINDKDNIVARVALDTYSLILDNQLKKIFKTNEHTDEPEDIVNLTLLIRDFVIDAINRDSKSSLQLGLKIHFLSVQTMLEMFKELGVTFSFEMSREAFIETRLMNLIEENLRDIITASMRKGDEDIIIDILFSFYKLMDLCVNNRDHLFFKISISMYSYAFYAYKKYYKNSDSLVVNRISTHLKEFADYNLIPKFELLLSDEKGKEDLEGYITAIFLIFNTLLKATLDYQDEESFNSIFKDYNKSFRDIGLHYQLHTLDQYTYELKFTTNAQRKAFLENEIEKYKSISSLQNLVNKHRKSIEYGIGAWVLNLLLNEKINKNFGEKVLNTIISRFGNIQEVSEFYFSLDRKLMKDMYSWDWWTLGELEEGVAHTLDQEWLNRFYCILLLKKFNSSSDTTSIAMPKKGEIDYFGAAGLKSVVDTITPIFQKIQDEITKYAFIIEVGDLEKINQIIEFHNKAVEKLKEEETQKIIDAKVPEEVKNKFKEDFLKAWNKETIVRNLLKKRKILIDLTNKRNRTKKCFGFDKNENKEFFLDTKTSLDKMGEHYGSQMAREEDNLFIADLVGNIKQKVTLGPDVINQLDIQLKKFRQKGYKPNLIVVHGHKLLYSLEGSNKFIRRMNLPKGSEYENFEGTYKGIPIFQSISPHTQDSIAIIDLNRTGRFYQLSFGDLPNEVFKIEINDYNQESIVELINKYPDILKKRGYSSQKELEREFFQYVHLLVLEKLKFIPKSKNAGILLVDE